MSVENKILKTKLVNWQDLVWLQPDNFKDTKPEIIAKLKKSLIQNGFASPFNIWENKTKTYILDGHHREKAMRELIEEGINVPSKLPANFLDCKNKKEAKKLVLVYNSHYATINPDSLFDFTIDLNMDDLKLEIDIPNIDLEINEKVKSVNEQDEWIGMPEFESNDGSIKLVIQFENKKLLEKYVFNKNIQIQTKYARTWSTWYPYKQKEDKSSLKYEV